MASSTSEAVIALWTKELIVTRHPVTLAGEMIYLRLAISVVVDTF